MLIKLVDWSNLIYIMEVMGIQFFMNLELMHRKQTFPISSSCLRFWDLGRKHQLFIHMTMAEILRFPFLFNRTVASRKRGENFLPIPPTLILVMYLPLGTWRSSTMNSWSANDPNQLLWRKLLLWGMDCMALYFAEACPLPKSHPSQAVPPKSPDIA